MNNKQIVTMILIAISIVIISAFLINYFWPMPENSYFENEKRDSLSTMLKKVDTLSSHFDVDEYNPYGESNDDTYPLHLSYTETSFETYPKKNDLVEEIGSLFSLDGIDYVFKSISTMNVNCITYSEGSMCNYIFGKKWAQVFMNDDEVYINYYRRVKNNFLISRDDFFNYEIHMKLVDEKLEMSVAINTYDLLAGYLFETTIYFKEGESVEIYKGGCEQCNYIYQHIDLETKDYFLYDGLDSDYEITYYHAAEEVLIKYSTMFNKEEFQYYLFDENHLVFSYNTYNNVLRYELTYVEGEYRLVRESGYEYSLYINDELLEEITVYIDDRGSISPYLYIYLEEDPLTAEVLSLNQIHLSSSVGLTDIIAKKDQYDNRIDEITMLYNIYPYQHDNDDLFDEKVINEDDSSIISFTP